MWYHSSFVLQLDRTLDCLRLKGLTPATILWNLTQGAPRPWDRQTMGRAKRTTQRHVYAALLADRQGYGWTRAYHKFKRWFPPAPAPAIVDRVLQNLRQLRTLVTPRVQAAMISTLWNRWTTARRFQVQGSPCLLGCNCPSGEDSIEHYLACPIVLSVAARRLRLHFPPGMSAPCCMLAHTPPATVDVPSWLLRCGVLVYATYRTTNTARNRGQLTPPVAEAALREAIYEGTRGHAASMRCVDQVYVA